MCVRKAPSHVSEGISRREYNFKAMHEIGVGLDETRASLELLARRYRPSDIVRYLDNRHITVETWQWRTYPEMTA